MRIDQGNFGQQVANLTPENVQHQEVTSVSQAQQSGAQQVGQAGVGLGKSIAQIGADLRQHYTQMAKLSAQQRVSEYSQYQQSVMDDIDTKVQQGQLDSRGAAAAFRQALDDKEAEYAKSPILDLDSEGKAYLDKGVGAAKATGAHRFGNYVEKVAWGEADRELDKTAASFGQMAQQGVPVDQARKAVIDFYDQNAAHYGPAMVEQKKAAMLKQVTLGNFRYRVEAAQNDNSALQQLKGEALKAGLDDAALASISGSIDTKVSRNEARAIAAQNHRDAVAQRRETAAGTAVNQMTRRLDNGEQPTEEDWQVYDSTVHGTGAAASGADTRTMQLQMVETQKAYSLPPDQLDSEVQRLSIKLDQNGGTKAEYAQRDAYQRVASQREKELAEDPQSLIARQNQQPLQPIAFDAANTTEFTELENRLNNIKQARQQFGYRAGDALLKPSEQKNFQAKWETMTPVQRADYATALRDGAGPEVADALFSSLKKVDPTITAVASVAHTPAGVKVAADMQVGQEMLKKGAVDVVPDIDLMSRIDSKYGDNLTPSQKLTVLNTIKPIVTARGQTKSKNDGDVIDEALSQVAGERVQITTQGFSHAYAIAPPGADTNQFANDMRRQLDMLPGSTGLAVRNGLDSGVYQIRQAGDGSYRITDGRRDIAAGGQTITLQVKK